MSARVSIANTPAAAIHSTGPAVGRKPSSSATPITAAAVSRLRIMLPATWPVSTDEREIAMVRNREKMPSLASVHTLIAVPSAAKPASSPGCRERG